MKISRRTVLGAGLALGLPSRLSAAEPADVVIAGAGLSGLYAARLLTAEGARVIVLEGTGVVGGRLKTLGHLPGKPEAGGQTIDAMYARVLREIDELELATMPRVAAVPGDTIIAGGNAMSTATWAQSQANRLESKTRALSPGRLYSHFLDTVNPITELPNWQDPVYAELDGFGVETLLRRAGAQPEALRLMQHWFDGGALSGMSALFACRKRLVETFGASAFYRIAGGSQALPHAMAAKLGNIVRLNAPVAAISSDAGGVEMRTHDGKRFRGRFGLVALPFPALRRVALDPAPRPLLRSAIAELPYSSIVMVTLAVREPFWEKDGLPPAMYADSWIQRITATPGQDGVLHSLAVWLRGEPPAMTDAALGAAIIEELGNARPSTKGALALADVTRWDARSPSGGAYHYFAPGQMARFFDVMRQPWGRVRFCGEHLADMQQGMEGACQAAEREAFAILQNL